MDRVSAGRREGEHGENPADQAAQMPADGDVGDGERERDVEHDDEKRATAEDVDPPPLEDEAGAQDPEDGARGADGVHELAAQRRAPAAPAIADTT